MGDEQPGELAGPRPGRPPEVAEHYDAWAETYDGDLDAWA